MINTYYNRSEAEQWLSEYRDIIEWVVSSDKDRQVGEVFDEMNSSA